jgi:hypothetical protein
VGFIEGDAMDDTELDFIRRARNVLDRLEQLANLAPALANQAARVRHEGLRRTAIHNLELETVALRDVPSVWRIEDEENIPTEAEAMAKEGI